MATACPQTKRPSPPTKYPTHRLRLGQSFARIIETKTGRYDWRLHNRIRSAVYRYMAHGGRGKKFSVIQEMRQANINGAPKSTLFVVVMRTE